MVKGREQDADEEARAPARALHHHVALPFTWTAWRSCGAVAILALAVGLQTVRSDNYFLGDDFGLVQHLHDQPAGRLLSVLRCRLDRGHLRRRARRAAASPGVHLLARCESFWLDQRRRVPLDEPDPPPAELPAGAGDRPLDCARRTGLRGAGGLSVRDHAESCGADCLDQRPGRFAGLVVLSGGVPVLRPLPPRTSTGLADRGAADLHLRTVCEAVAGHASADHPGLRPARPTLDRLSRRGPIGGATVAALTVLCAPGVVSGPAPLAVRQRASGRHAHPRGDQ